MQASQSIPDLRPVSWGILIYAGSAALTSLSAALYVAADAYRLSSRDAIASTLVSAGTALLIGGLALAFLSLTLLTIGFLALRRTDSSRLHPVHGVYLGISSFLWGAASLAIGAPLLALGFSWGRSSQAFAVGGTLVAVAGILFVVAITFIGMAFADLQGRICLRIAAVTGTVGVLAEVTLLFESANLKTNDWVTFGGMPLLNLNLPLGLVVAASALLFWASYRRILLDRRTSQNDRGLAAPD